MSHDSVAASVRVRTVPRRFVWFTALTVIAAALSLATLAWRSGGHLETNARFWVLGLLESQGKLSPIPAPRDTGSTR